jgi:hypothetical protein
VVVGLLAASPPLKHTKMRSIGSERRGERRPDSVVVGEEVCARSSNRIRKKGEERWEKRDLRERNEE